MRVAHKTAFGQVTINELQKILTRSASILNVAMNSEGAMEIASRCRGTPRIVNRLLRRVRDFAEVKGTGEVTLPIARQALQILEIAEQGFDSMDRKILLTIIEKFSGGPVGVEAIASAINEQRDTIEDVYEPFLLQQGFINRTSRGRTATQNAYSHFNLPFKVQKEQTNLF